MEIGKIYGLRACKKGEEMVGGVEIRAKVRDKAGSGYFIRCKGVSRRRVVASSWVRVTAEFGDG